MEPGAQIYRMQKLVDHLNAIYQDLLLDVDEENAERLAMESAADACLMEWPTSWGPE